jgi:hypothetical protein
MDTGNWQFILLPSLLFFAIVTNILWFYIKAVLQARGYKVHLLWNHSSDILNLHRLIKNEVPQDARPPYIRLLTLFYISLGMTIVCFVLFVVTA